MTVRISDASRDVLEEALIRYLEYIERERDGPTASPERVTFCNAELDLIHTAFTEVGIDPEHITR